MHILCGIIRVTKPGCASSGFYIQQSFKLVTTPVVLIIYSTNTLVLNSRYCFCYVKQRKSKNFKGGEIIIMKLPIDEKLQELSGTGKSMNWLLSSFFSWNTHGLFQCCFSIFLTYYLHIMASLEFFFSFLFFFFRNYSVLSSSFMPRPLVPICLCFLVQIPRRWSDQPTSCLLGASHSTESSTFDDCSPQLCGGGQGAGCITRCTVWLWSVRGMGRAVSQKNLCGKSKHADICRLVIVLLDAMISVCLAF